ncbi:MAG: molybdate ABC transporter substrate-binding protein [bacterium]|nr:molybdate ABC transporter substrate-binding protein [bacterium]
MKKLLALITILGGILGGCTGKQNSLHLFAGAAGKPAIDEAAKLFEQEYGIKVEVTYGGSGAVLSQILLSQRGDVYIPGSDDYMDKAESKGAVISRTRRIICYLKPSIVVRKGNPKGIKGLEDLTQPGLKVAIGTPEAVCLGDIALEIFRQAGIEERIRPNIVTQAHNCLHLLTLLKLKQVDAIIGWDFYEHLAPQEAEVVELSQEIVQSRNIPAAVISFSKQKKSADKFVRFITAAKGKEIFARYGYLDSEKFSAFYRAEVL